MHLRAPRQQYPTPALLSFEVQGDLRHTPCPLRIHTPTLIPLTLLDAELYRRSGG
jgi:hypothetical protein